MQSIYFLATRLLSARSASAVLIASGALVSGCATAQQNTEYGTVVSSTPVLAPVTVPQQQCYDEPEAVAPRRSGGGALAGAVIGGLIGSTMGGGSGRVAATGAGVVLGAVIGDRVEAHQQPLGVGMVRRCQTVNVTESRVVAYDVVYDYAGRRFSTRLNQDPGAPGSLLPVSVNVAGAANNPGYNDDGTPVTSPQVGSPPNVIYNQTQPSPYNNRPATTVYYTETVRPVYVAPPVYYAPPPPVFFRHPPRHFGGGTVYYRDGRRDDRRDNRPIDPPRPEDGRRWRH
jgi:uncharacterized protein YcfJ